LAFSMAVTSEDSLAPFALSDGYDTDDSAESERRHRGSWLFRLRSRLTRMRFQRRQARAVSEYEVLIRDGDDLVGSSVLPLSDPRLRPRLPKLLIIFLLLLSMGGILCVFFLVPRGVTIGEPTISVIQFTVDAANQSFTLVVNVTIPFKNPNYVSVDISGDVQMRYYNVNAGVNNINETISKRHTTNKTVRLDSSNLTLKYISTVVQHCFAFPRQEVFFISGEFKAKYLLQTQHLSFDTYRYISCPVGNDAASSE